MWISNTATTIMMLPIMDSVLEEMCKKEQKGGEEEGDMDDYNDIEDKEGRDERKEKSEESSRLRGMLALGIAYAANIGGTGTIIGTPPNLILFDVLESFDGQPITFFSWIVLSVPQVYVKTLYTIEFLLYDWFLSAHPGPSLCLALSSGVLFRNAKVRRRRIRGRGSERVKEGGSAEADKEKVYRVGSPEI
jgi:hypothetical protein